MGKKEKLIARIRTRPKDVTFREVQTLFGYLGYQETEKGRTSGSRVCFSKDGVPSFLLHKTHGRKNLLRYEIEAILDLLEKEGV